MRTWFSWLGSSCKQLLVQIAQIYFQPSAFAGLVILAALAWARPWAALGMILGGLSALLTARLAEGRTPSADARAGLWGYNASLAGAGLLSLYTPDAALYAYVVLSSIVTTLVSRRWLAWGKLPLLTFPFVLTMWGAYALQHLFVVSQALPDCDGRLVGLVPCGIGQVAFIGGVLPGLAVWAAIMVRSQVQGGWLALGTACGVVLSAVVAPWLSLTCIQTVGPAINLGLTAQALTVFARSVRVRLVGIVVGALLCAVLSLLLTRVGIRYFTFPFNLATWLMLLVSRAQPDPGSSDTGSRASG